MCALIVVAAFGSAQAMAAAGPAAELSPDMRPVLVLQLPQGELLLVHHAGALVDRRAPSLAQKLGSWIAAPVIHRDREERRTRLPSPWLTLSPDRGFSQALLMQLSQLSANWPWRTLVVSSSGPESDSQLQTLPGQDAIVAAVRAELVDLGNKVEFHVLLDMDSVRAVATTRETRVRTQVEYFAPALAADHRQPRRNLAVFAANGPLDDQVSTAAADLSQFLATIVARVSVPDSLRPHNPSWGELRMRPTCSVCRASDPVVYLQPGRVWVRLGKPPGNILALPRPVARSLQPRMREFGPQAIP